MSFNYHKEHFGEVWGLHNAKGEVLHTGCVAFGMDRLAVALFATHGADSRTATGRPACREALAASTKHRIKPYFRRPPSAPCR